MRDTQSVIDALVCAALRGEKPAWPWRDEPSAVEAFLARTRLHGVQALLHAAPVEPGWPLELRNAFREQAIHQAMWELRHQQLLAEALRALAGIDVHPVLIKGTPMAYSLYPDPAMRTRADTDLIIPPHKRAAAFAALEALGFRRDLAVSGEFVSYQSNFSIGTADGPGHTLDVHWKINNSEVLSRVLSYEEAYKAARPLPALCRDALAVGPAHGLLITAMHRASHIQNPYYVDGVAHYGGDRLIWLYDIHLLAHALGEEDWQAFCRLARDREVDSVCLQALRDAQDQLGTDIPAGVAEYLASPARTTTPARYLAAGKPQQQWMDFLALRGWSAKLRYISESLFPPANYMRSKYAGAANAWLPWLYLRRAVAGACKTIGLGRT